MQTLKTTLLAYPLMIVVVTSSQPNVERAPVSPQQFVQNFYDWYAPKSSETSGGSAVTRALRERRSDFSSELARALAADIAASSKVAGEIVELDFDPFLASQDRCEKYEAGRVVRQGAVYSVDLFAVCSGSRHQSPDVSVQLAVEETPGCLRISPIQVTATY